MGLFGPNPNLVAFQNIAAHFGAPISGGTTSFRIHRSGCDYQCEYHQHKSTITLQIKAEKPNLPDVEMRKESGTDRFGKRIGLNYELQTGDRLFDDHVFVVCGRDNTVLDRLLEPDAVRKGILFVLKSGFDRIAFGKHGFTAHKLCGSSFAITQQQFEEILAALEMIEQALPEFRPGEIRYQTFKPFGLVGVALGVSGITGLVLLIAGSTQFPTLDNALHFSSVGAGVLVWLVTVFLAGRFLRGKPDAFRAWIMGTILGLGIAPVLCIGIALVVNGWLDTSPPVTHTALIQNMQTVRNKNSRTYYLYVKSWRPTESTLKIKVPANYYLQRSIGKNATISTKKGHWGWEWVSSP